MTITKTLDLTSRKNGDFVINNKVVDFSTISETTRQMLEAVYWDLKNFSQEKRAELFNLKYATNDGFLKNEDYKEFCTILGLFSENEEKIKNPDEMIDKEKKDIVCHGISNLIKFFQEFEFEPNYRFLNTLALKVSEKNGKTVAMDYIKDYFKLIDSIYVNKISEKIKSPEFQHILTDFELVKPKHKVNNRFKLYYGSQGTGKTTKAMEETNKKVIICNSSMLPSDLMEDFDFDCGNATFKPSTLWKCMENGVSVVFDEINLLPYESLRFLQGLVDGKDEFIYKGKKVVIKDGFEIIGTMNLQVNGMTYGLPEPLVDRCGDIKQFKLTSKQLFSAFC